MLPLHRPRAPVAAPLLTFPPCPSPPPRLGSIDSASSPLDSALAQLGPRRRPRRAGRSLCYRVLSLVPLGFIYSLLSFSFYTVVYSLTYDYLVVQRRERTKALCVVATYAALLGGCGASLMQCYAKSDENFVRRERRRRQGGGSDDGEFDLDGDHDGGDDNDDDDDDDDDDACEARDEEESIRVDPFGSREWETTGLLVGQETGPTINHSGRTLTETTTTTMQVKSDGTKRFCRKCNVLKPDRAHHCSTCQRCVLKMDHHCPWLGGGCVGYANYKFFLQFLLYTGALGVYISVVCFYSLVHYTSDEPSGFEMAPISWALAALLGVIFGSATGLFGLYHLYLAATNRTTIEAMESLSTFSTTLPPRHLIDRHLALAATAAASSSSSSRTTSNPTTKTTTPSRSAIVSQLARRLNPRQKLRLERAKRRYNVYDLGWRANLREVFLSEGDVDSRDRTMTMMRTRTRTRTRTRGVEGEGTRGGGRRQRSDDDGLGKVVVVTSAARWWEWIAPWGRPAGDGYSFPINVDHLTQLEQVSREIWAEVEAEERERSQSSISRQQQQYHDSEYRGARANASRPSPPPPPRWEVGLTREGTLVEREGNGETTSDDDDDDKPLRRVV